MVLIHKRSVLATVIVIRLFRSIFGTELPSHQRRVLRPTDNVGEILRGSLGRDVARKKRFTIHTEIQSGSQGAGTELAMDVVETIDSAVTLDTKIKDDHGNEFTVGEDILLYNLLVTDIETADGADTFAILAVNPETDDMHGVVEKRGRFGERVAYKINQNKRANQGKAIAQEEMDLSTPDWHCGVSEDVGSDILEEKVIRDNSARDENISKDDRQRLEEQENRESERQGFLSEDTLDRKLVQAFEGQSNIKYKRHHHEHEDRGLTTMEALTKSLRDIKANPLNKPRRLQAASYNFQVDLFIEIDNGLIDKMGSLNNAINYVNSLVSGANVVYEKEIDTHLRVTDIVVSTLYDAATSSSDALNHYGGGTWHSPNVDLHHALLGGLNAGGISYIGVVCRSDYGFGLTSGINGNFVSMGKSTLWDMKGFMHEIGHNFGSKHSNDVAHYDPAVDGCGAQCPTTIGYGWSVIMSVCQGCPGAYENIMYTFGGDYDGSGDVNDLSNWPDNPTLIANYDSTHQSVDPSRVAQRMYLHIFSKAPSGCVDLSSPAPLLTPSPTHSPTSSSGLAMYDGGLGAPKCTSATASCDSGGLLNSRDAIAGVAEPNGPNTLDACKDGAAGTYHSDESVDSIKISTVGGGTIQPGATVKIEASVWAYSATADFVDFFYATDATNPQWQLISTVSPSSSGAITVSTQYILGNGSLQAVRVVIRYNGAASSCPGGSYDDVDDLVFATDGLSPSPPTSTSRPTPQPTRLPTQMPTRPPTSLPTSKPVSSCDVSGTACDSKGPDNCCYGCQRKGRWANTCK